MYREEQRDPERETGITKENSTMEGYTRAERTARALQRKKRSRIRRIKSIWNGITTALVAVALILAILIWGLRLIGMDVFIVQSGSMEPAYKVGSVVYVSKADPENLKVGDVITFRLAEGMLGTHRIIDVLDENGTPAFRTKGDANDSADSGLITPENIVGKVRFAVPELGYFVAYIQEPPGSYFAYCVMAGLLALTLLPDIIFEEPGKKKEKKSSAERRRKAGRGKCHEDMSESTKPCVQEDKP